MPWSPAIFEKKNEFFIPVKNNLSAADLGKVNSFIIEQIRIIEFCPLNIIVLTTRI